MIDLDVKQEYGLRQGQKECFVHYFVQLKGLAKYTSQFFTIFLGSKITVDGDFSYDIINKGCFVPWKKIYGKPRQRIKNRDITLPTKGHVVKVIVFPVVKYGYESWTINKAECRRIDAFSWWCWRRLLRVPWTARQSNQSILKEFNP